MIKLIQQYFEESSQKYPDHPAVIFKGVKITYTELDSTSNQLARALKARGVKRGDRVGFCLSKSLKAVNAILGTLKADAVYVPLNAKAPVARLQQIVNDVAPRLVICDNASLPLVETFAGIFNLDSEKDFVSDQPTAPLAYKNESSDLAYILYTSGSTGKPKGVMITHANIINATDWAVSELGITHMDKMSQHPPLHFDLSTFDLYCAWKAGATLFLVPEEYSLFPGQLIKFIEENRLTIWNSVPSVMVHLAIAGLVKPGRMQNLTKVLFNGEGFPSKFLAEWMTAFSEKTFVNLYGPTETTVQCSFYIIKEPPTDFSKFVPIGKATGGMEIFAVTDSGFLAKPSEVGELYVDGLGVGKGYWNDPERTAISFIKHPFKSDGGIIYKTGDLVRLREDGNYEFIGRKDNQVKIRGNRVELGDVEAALNSLPYVNESAAIAVFDLESGGNKLNAFVNLKETKSVEEIKKDLAKLVPQYLIPDEIHRRELPKTSTGKIDRVKLREEIQVTINK